MEGQVEDEQWNGSGVGRNGHHLPEVERVSPRPVAPRSMVCGIVPGGKSRPLNAGEWSQRDPCYHKEADQTPLHPPGPANRY